MKRFPLASFFLILLLPICARSSTITIACSYGEFDIAIKGAHPGDTIIVQPGVIYGPYLPAIVLIDGKTDLVLVAEGGKEVTILDGNGDGCYPILIQNSINITICGFTLLNSGIDMVGSVTMNNSQGINILDCTLRDSAYGARINHFCEATISNCDIHDNAAGILVEQGAAANIIANDIHDNIWVGVSVSAANDVATYVSIVGNRLYGNTEHAIESRYLGIGQMEISNNLIYQNSMNGISLASNIMASIINNSIIANGGAGIQLSGLNSPTISKNVIALNEYVGICVYSGCNPYFSCNDVWSNSHFANGNYVGYITDQTGYNGNISGDPFFCNASVGDYSLAANSPALLASCGAMGAITTPGCSNQTPVEQVTWGAIKALYR